MVPARRMYLLMAAAATAGIPVALVLGRGTAPTGLCIGALGTQAALCGFLAWATGRPRDDLPAVVAAAAAINVALMGVLMLFFGPFSGLSAFVALMIVVAATLEGGPGGRFPSIDAAWVLVILSAAHLGSVFGVLSGALPDAAIQPLRQANLPLAASVALTIAVQVLYLAAFIGGRALRRRYLELARETDELSRAITVREALVEEARADYERAVLSARRTPTTGVPALAPLPQPSSPADGDDEPSRTEIVSPRRGTGPISRPSIPTVAAAPITGPSSRLSSSMPRLAALLPADDVTPTPPAARDVWHRALRAKRRGERIAVSTLAVGGSLLIWFILPSFLARVIGVAGLLTICVLVGLEAWTARRQPARPPPDWPWTLVAVCGVFPAYAYGLHSSFSAVIVTVLFTGSLLRASVRRRLLDGHAVVVLAVFLSHSTMFGLVLGGVLPDAGLLPITPPDARPHEAFVHHAVLLFIYGNAYIAGAIVDRRFEIALARAMAAAQEAARQQALLTAARAEVEGVLARHGEGLFSNTRQGHYELGLLIARGGMGDVYEAIDVHHGTPAAVKLIRRELVADARILERFRAEITALALVSSPHVARVYGAGGFEGGVPYLAMERVAGETLARRLTRGPMPREALALLVQQAAQGLADVHAAAVVHLDVKPQNLVDAGDGASPRWVLVDFGLAQLVGGPDARTRDPAGGTPHYMAPEQIRGETLDRRADLYGLALVIYRAVTGRPAFSPKGRVEQVLAGQIIAPPPPRRSAEIPEALELALRVGLAERPEDRYGSAEELAAAFLAALKGEMAVALRRHARQVVARDPWG